MSTRNDLSQSLVNVNPEQAASIISKMVPASLNVLLVGSPGVGKTVGAIKEAIDNIDMTQIWSYPVTEQPEDLRGFPFLIKTKTGHQEARFLPIGQMKEVIDGDEPVIWVLDDLGQGMRATQAAYMQLLHGGRLGDFVIPKGTVFLAATNNREDNAGVDTILEPVKDRFCTILKIVADPPQWIRWATKKGLHPIVTSFIELRKEYLSDFTPTKDPALRSPTPRSWEGLSNALYAGIPSGLELPVFQGAVGPGCALEFSQFFDMFTTLPDLFKITITPDDVEIPQKPDIIIACIGALTSMIVEDNKVLANVAKWINRISNVEYQVIFWRRLSTINDTFRNSPEFTTWARKNSSVVLNT